MSQIINRTIDVQFEFVDVHNVIAGQVSEIHTKCDCCQNDKSIDITLSGIDVAVDLVQVDPNDYNMQVIIGSMLKGDKGDDGKSAYQIWLENGHHGSEEDFLEWLKADNVQSDWEQNDTEADDYIKNKPQLMYWEAL